MPPGTWVCKILKRLRLWVDFWVLAAWRGAKVLRTEERPRGCGAGCWLYSILLRGDGEYANLFAGLARGL